MSGISRYHACTFCTRRKSDITLFEAVNTAGVSDRFIDRSPLHCFVIITMRPRLVMPGAVRLVGIDSPNTLYGVDAQNHPCSITSRLQQT